MKQSNLTRILSAVLIMAIAAMWLPIGAASAAVGYPEPTDPPFTRFGDPIPPVMPGARIDGFELSGMPDKRIDHFELSGMPDKRNDGFAVPDQTGSRINGSTFPGMPDMRIDGFELSGMPDKRNDDFAVLDQTRSRINGSAMPGMPDKRIDVPGGGRFASNEFVPDDFVHDDFIPEESISDGFVPGEVLASADSWEHAQSIAEAYDLELKSYAQGIAVLAAPDPELTVAQSKMTRARSAVTKLGLNRI
jgi:hypothetical protein